MVLPEPVEEWQNVNGTDLLDLMFHNGSRYFGTFQLESSFTRYIIPVFVFQFIEWGKMLFVSFSYLQIKTGIKNSSITKPESWN